MGGESTATNWGWKFRVSTWIGARNDKVDKVIENLVKFIAYLLYPF